MITQPPSSVLNSVRTGAICWNTVDRTLKLKKKNSPGVLGISSWTHFKSVEFRKSSGTKVLSSSLLKSSFSTCKTTLPAFLDVFLLDFRFFFESFFGFSPSASNNDGLFSVDGELKEVRGTFALLTLRRGDLILVSFTFSSSAKEFS